MTPHYEIIANGVSMGIFAGDNREQALDAYARDAGYGSYPALLDATDGGDDARVEEVNHTLFDFDEDGDTIVPGYDATAFRVFVEPLDGAVRVTVYAVEGPDGEHVKLHEETQTGVAFNLDAALSAATIGLENARSAHERAVDEIDEEFVAWVAVGRISTEQVADYEEHPLLLSAELIVKGRDAAAATLDFSEWIDESGQLVETATAYDEGGGRSSWVDEFRRNDTLSKIIDDANCDRGDAIDAIRVAAEKQVNYRQRS